MTGWQARKLEVGDLIVYFGGELATVDAKFTNKLGSGVVIIFRSGRQQMLYYDSYMWDDCRHAGRADVAKLLAT